MRFAMSFLVTVLAASPAFAWKGTISFTPEEKAAHAAVSQTVATVAAECLNEKFDDHMAFFKLNGVSKYFGNRRYIKGEVPGRRADGAVLTPIRPELRKHGFSVDIEEQMTSISCVDLARLCLSKGFAAVNQSDLWERIDAFNQLNDNIGTIVQVGLQALGWKMVYWNPDPSQNKAWDAGDMKRSPKNGSNVWGYHAYRYATVMNKNKYYEYTVDDKTTLVGFKNTLPAVVQQIPFFVGIAHTGYHVFLGTYGEVIEAHSVRSLFGEDNMQKNPFSPMNGVGPKSTASEVYRSGLVVVPPNSL